jgi:AraC-like DNA-binding protein
LEQDQASNRQAAESVILAAMAASGMTIMPTSAQRFPLTAKNQGRAEPVQIWRARGFIHEHSADELSLTKVAKAVNMSANHLSERFKEVTGINFVHYVARARFEKARDLLEDPNLRVSEIAFAVGFQSLSQFNRVFRRLSAQSPTEYRAARGKAQMRLPARPIALQTGQNFCRRNA